MTGRIASLVLAALILSGCAALGVGSGADAGFRPPEGRARAEALLRVAEVANRDGDDASAVAMYRAAAAVRPSWAEPEIGLARALLRQGDWDGARLAFARAQGLDLPRRDMRASVGLAQAELLAGRPEAALRGFQAALAADPRSVPAAIGAGIALDRLGRHAEAQASYAQALRLDPDSKAARNNLGLSLALSGKGAEAVAVLTPLLGGGDEPPQARANMALAMSGRQAGAAQPFGRAQGADQGTAPAGWRGKADGPGALAQALAVPPVVLAVGRTPPGEAPAAGTPLVGASP